jgi:hypothetical protein
MAILSTLLGTSAIAITPNLSTDSAITVIMFCNLNTSIENIDVHVVASGETPTNTNKIVSQAPIDPSDTFIFSTERLVLSPGDRIFALTTTVNMVSVTASYVVI